ncbi:MAG: V-type ATP synthase subunit I [Clostridiales bacterium]|jgi:V/A-type H+-transporting ATPase subunit I|nr:V-type ATP synthase subunit I [Clostridiales bacterium]
MAKLKMKRFEAVCAIEDSRDLVDWLQRCGFVELSEFEEDDRLARLSVGTSVSQFEKILSAAESALKNLDKYAPEKKSFLESFNYGVEISSKEYEERSENIDGIISKCIKINSTAKKIDENKAAAARYRALSDQLEPWLALDVPMQFRGTGSTAAFIGSFQKEYDIDGLTLAIGAEEPEIDFYAEVVFSSRDQTGVFVLCAKDDAQKMESALRSLGFVKPSDPTRHRPEIRFERYQKQISTLEDEIYEHTQNLADYGNLRRDIEFAADYFSVKRDKYKALANIAANDKLIALKGFLPERKAAKLVEKIEKKFIAAVAVTEPSDDEETPVLLKNGRFGGAVESVTEMYSIPGKDDVDPNPVMAFFYYILFGIMLSDAGYGVVMVVAMLFAKSKLRLSSGMKKATDMFLYCGISTVFWGAMFGSWFGDIAQVVALQFFGRELPSLALWFEPVDDPMKMMLFSFLIGIVHLFAGLAVKFSMLWKSGQRLAAFFDVIPVYLLVMGAAPLGAGIITEISPAISAAGKYLAIAGVALIVLTSGRSSKNIFGKLGGGLYGLYNIGAGYLGDILSYSRLLALGLSTGVIASVINLLGTMASGTFLKAVMLIFVFIFGHTVNIAINLIGTYVHTNRLQYVEFFSKFYEGGGRAFTPLKVNTKYYSIKED